MKPLFPLERNYMKIAIITDTHLDVRASSPVFIKYMGEFYENVLFPYMQDNDIDNLFHLGDFMDNRNHISLAANNYAVIDFNALLRRDRVKMTALIGNHDLAFRNTSKIHSMVGIEAANPELVDIIVNQKLIELDGQKFMMCGWINAENQEAFSKMISEYDDKENTILCGHFEIAGFKHYADTPPAEHGMEMATFEGWKEVWSGHYHHASQVSNIKYLGALFPLNWHDYGDKRGFSVYDTETGVLEFIENTTSLFYEVVYNDEAEFDGEVEGKFVRVVKNVEVESEAMFLEFIRSVQKKKPLTVDVLDNTITKLGVSASDKDQVAVEKHVKELDAYFAEYADHTFGEHENKDAIIEILKKRHDEAMALSFVGEN